MNEIILPSAEFSPRATFECGQCFRWTVDDDGVWSGVAFGKTATVREDGENLILTATQADFDNVWRAYFDMDTNYAAIRQHVSINAHMVTAAQFGRGIRILRQEKWEALCSFIISQCNNIPRIRSIVENLSALLGDEIDEGVFAFAPVERVAAATEQSLASLRAGYRTKYIISAARELASGRLDLEKLSSLAPEQAHEEIKRLQGVGDKVAACFVLFGLHMLDAFPVDTWMKKAIARHYGAEFEPGIFSPYAGVAQQYMFYFERSGQ